MKQTINKDQFRHAFQNMGRGEQFSYEALGLLFDYIEMIESETGEQIELDVIALCCDFAEMTLADVIQAYGLEIDTTEDEARQWLSEETILCGITSDNTFLFHQF